MNVFYISCLVLLAAAVVFLFWPLIAARLSLQQPLAGADLREVTNVSLYRDHLAELDQSLSLGAIDDAQYAELKTELERNLLADSQSSVMDVQTSTGKRTLFFYAGLAIAICVSAVMLYQHLGAYESVRVRALLEDRSDLELQLSQAASAQQQDQLQQEVNDANNVLVVKLKGHLDKFPEDLQMRALLARTSTTLGDYTTAITHYQIILEQDETSSQIMAELAQVVFLSADNQVVPIVQRLVTKVLELDPLNNIALGLAGIAAFQGEEYELAISFWRRAIEVQGADSPNSIALESGISAALQRLESSSTQETGLPVAEENSSADPVLESEADAVDDQPRLALSVSLGDGIELSDDAVVFIYARAWPGARIPLAITRLSASDLPAALTLTNAMSMAPNMNLSSADQVELVARVSNSGEPIPKAGDWQVTLGPIDMKDAAIVKHTYSLVITEQLP